MLIKIEVKGRSFAVAELDQRNQNIANKLYQMLPIEATANLWGEEIYFEIPLKNEDENTSRSSVEGDVSYWSPGNAFCIFFGQTQPYSPVNHLGKILEGLEIFCNVKAGDKIILNRK